MTDVDQPATRRDLALFREAIKSDFVTFEAHTREVVVGLMQEILGLAEALDALRDAGARIADHERRIATLEDRVARMVGQQADKCATCPLRPGDLGEAE